MSRTKDHLIDHMNSERAILAEGPLSMSEAELAALETQGAELVSAGKLVREHLSNCPYSDQKTLDAFDLLLKYAGIHDLVTKVEPVERPQGEMACHNCED